MKTALSFTLSTLLGAATFLTAPVLSAQVLLSEDFETGQTVGSAPTGATGTANGNGTDYLSRIVTGAENPAGGGGVDNEGLRLMDNSGTGAVGIEYNIVDSAAEQISAFRMDLNFSILAGAADSTSQILISAGQFSTTSPGLTLNSSGRRAFELRLFPDQTIDFVSTNGPDDTNRTFLTGQNSISLFVNDFDSEAITYIRPDNGLSQSLAANSVAYYLNNALILTTSLDSEQPENTQWLTTENNFGRVGITSFSNSLNIDYNFDNIVVTALVPEPETGALMLLSGIGVVLSVRRRRRD